MGFVERLQSNTFNGIQLPSIAVFDPADDSMWVVLGFAYKDFKGRFS
jgi:carboxynorspermidine decarboxylase